MLVGTSGPRHPFAARRRRESRRRDKRPISRWDHYDPGRSHRQKREANMLVNAVAKRAIFQIALGSD